MPGGFTVAQVYSCSQCAKGVLVTALNACEGRLELLSPVYNKFFEVVAVPFDLLLKAPLSQGAIHRSQHKVHLKRFENIIVTAFPHGLHADADVTDSRGNQEGGIWIEAAHFS